VSKPTDPEQAPSGETAASSSANAAPSGPADAGHDALAEWCASAARLVQLARRWGAERPETQALRAQLASTLPQHVAHQGAISLDVTPRAILLAETVLLTAEHANAPAGEGELGRELPWVLYRDGVRRLHLEAGLREADVLALLDVVLEALPASGTHEDLVTLLWDRAPQHVRLETEDAPAARMDPLALPSPGAPARHASDWPLGEAPSADLPRLWLELERDAPAHATSFAERWRTEHEEPFADSVGRWVAELRSRDARPAMADAIAAGLVTWLATAVQRTAWVEAQRALELLEDVDPGRARAGEAVEHALAHLDATAISERLDVAEPEDQARAFAFAVRLGPAALPLLMEILARTNRSRVRAGITTALAYSLADDPTPLAHWLDDPSWQLVRNVVFVLGQVGGPAVVPLLARAARHVDARVRRAAVQSMGQVPAIDRRTILLAQLDGSDVRHLVAALAMLAREPDAALAEAVLARVAAPEFQARSEEQRVALIEALPDLAGERAVPVLAGCLADGGWFARPGAARTAAAHALRRIDADTARNALEQGRRHRAAAVREACEEALGREDHA